MTIRILVKLELAALFLSLLILSTFIQFRLPFISFLLPQLPDTRLVVEQGWFYAGTYSGNLQVPMVFLMLVVLEGALASLTLGAYLLLGLMAFPIFFYGGGMAYIQQPTFGYLAVLLPAAWLWMFLLRRHRRRQIPLTRYIWISLLSLGLIHLVGGLYAALYYQLIPLEFLLTFVLPQLTWQMPSVLFVVLLGVQVKGLFQPRSRPRTVTRHAA